MDQRTEIALECVFCSSTKFEIPGDDYCPQQGELIKCGNCGKLNDFSSLEKVVHAKGKEWVKSQADKILKDAFKKMSKNLKIKL